MKLLRGFVFLNIAIVVTNLAAYGYQLMASRGLSVSDYGAWSVLFSFNLIVYIPGAGLNLLLARRVAELAIHGGPELRRYVRNMARTLAVFVSIGGVFLFLSLIPIGHFLLPSTPIVALILMGVTTVLMLTVPLPLGVLQGVEHYGWLGFIQVLRSLLTLVSGSILVAFGTGLVGVVLGAGIGNLGCLLVGSYLVKRSLSGHSQVTSHTDTLSSSEAENYPLVTGTLALLTVMFYVDTLFSRRFLGPETAGFYSVIAVAARTVYYAPLAPLTLIVPRVAARAAQGRDTRPLLAAGLGLTLMLVVPIVGAFAVAPRLFLRLLFGSVYADSAVAGLLPWYAAAIGFLTVSTFLVYYFMACRRLIYIGGLVAGLVVLVTSMALVHDTPGDLVRAIFLGNGVAALLLVGLAVITSFRTKRPVVGPGAAPQSLSATSQGPVE